jgi:tetratricopeptide (TPR) repeat protein
MLCPKCKAEYKGALARCTHCSAELLPKKSLLRSRLPALALGLVGLIPPFLFFLGPRVPSFFLSAFGPTLLGDRYRFRAEDVLKSDPEQAVADFTKALELAPQWVHAGRARMYCLRGEAYVALGSTREAMADFEQALKGWTSDSAVGRSKGYVDQVLGDLQADHLDPNTIEDEQQRAAVYARRAEAFYRRAHDPASYAQAAEEAGRAIELDRRSGSGYRVRGYAYYRMGQVGAAIKDLEKAASLVSNPALATGIRRDIERFGAGAAPEPFRG